MSTKWSRKIMRQKKAQERRSYRYFKAIFDRQIELVIDSFTGNLEALIDSVPLLIGQTIPDEQVAYSKTWGDCGRTFGYQSREMTIQNSKSIRLRRKEISAETWETSFYENAVNHINETSLLKATQIAGTNATLIQNQLNNILTQSINEGWSIDKITKELQTSFKDDSTAMSKYRAQTIARTEVNSAANWSTMDGAKSLGMPIQKRWLTSGLQGVRASHTASMAQGWIDENLTFVNGLHFCGDQSTGDVGEFINCRCTTLTRVKL